MKSYQKDLGSILSLESINNVFIDDYEIWLLPRTWRVGTLPDNVLLGCEEIIQARWWEVIMHEPVGFGVSSCLVLLSLGSGSPCLFPGSIFSPRTYITEEMREQHVLSECRSY